MIISDLKYFQLISKLNYIGENVKGGNNESFAIANSFALVDDSNVPSSSIKEIGVGGSVLAGVGDDGAFAQSEAFAFIAVFNWVAHSSSMSSRN